MQKVKRYIEKIVTMESQAIMTKVITGMAMMVTVTITRVTMAMEKVFQCRKRND